MLGAAAAFATAAKSAQQEKGKREGEQAKKESNESAGEQEIVYAFGSLADEERDCLPCGGVEAGQLCLASRRHARLVHTQTFGHTVSSVSISGDTRRLAGGDAKGEVVVYDFTARCEVFRWRDTNQVFGVSLSYRGEEVAICGAAKAARVSVHDGAPSPPESPLTRRCNTAYLLPPLTSACRSSMSRLARSSITGAHPTACVLLRSHVTAVFLRAVASTASCTCHRLRTVRGFSRSSSMTSCDRLRSTAMDCCSQWAAMTVDVWSTTSHARTRRPLCGLRHTGRRCGWSQSRQTANSWPRVTTQTP